MTDVLGYLSAKGVELKQAGANNVHTSCWYCGEDPSKRGRLYINVDPTAEPPGLFMCHLCDKRGAFNAIRKYFGDPVLSDDKEETSYKTHEILQAAAEYYHVALGENEDAFLYLRKERGLSAETIINHKLGWADGGLRKHLSSLGYSVKTMVDTGLVDQRGQDFLRDNITIPYMMQGNVVCIRGKEIGGKYLTPPGQKARLFNSDVTWDQEHLVITEGEFDCLVLEQLGFAAVGSPGANTWQDAWTDYFKQAKRVFVCFDNDGPGRAGAEKVSRLIGPKARIVSLEEAPPGQPKNDPSHLVVNKGYGKSDFDLLFIQSKGGQLLSVDACYEEWKETKALSGIQLGYDAIDGHILPGLLPGQLMVVLAKSGVGKQEPLTAAIPTPNGFKTMGELRVGDQVFGRNGKPTTVIGYFPQGVRKTFKVTFSDRSSRLVGDQHLWEVMYRHGRGREWTPVVRTTQELFNSDLRRGSEWRWTIPVCEPVEYPERALPIEPYTLGALIANGSLTGSSAVLSTPDDFVVKRVDLFYPTKRHKPYDVCPRYSVKGVIGKVRALGLNRRSRDKFIPQEYLIASVRQRIDLLQGLMDCDGSGSGKDRSCVKYHTSSRRLAADVTELVNSLGGTASTYEIDREHEGKKVEYRLSIMLPWRIEPFSTPEKHRLVSPKNRTGPRRAIINIEEVDPVESACIAVDAPDHLYLSGHEYVVTHNTLFLLNVFERMLQSQPNIRILFVSLEQTRGEWFERALRIHRFYNLYATEEDCLNYYRGRLLLVDKNRLTEDEFLNCVDQFEYEVGQKPDVVAVDYLGYWARSFKGERYERTSDAIMSLKALGKDARVSIITPHQVGRNATYGDEPDADSARDSGVVEETADFLFTLWSADNRKGRNVEEQTGEVNLRIGKSRQGGKGQLAQLQFAPLSLVMVPKSDPLSQRARDETLYSLNGDTYAQAIQRHRTGAKDLYVEEAIL